MWNNCIHLERVFLMLEHILRVFGKANLDFSGNGIAFELYTTCNK